MIKKIPYMSSLRSSILAMLILFCSTAVYNTTQAQCPVTIDSVTATNPSCNGVCDGTVTINVSGGFPPYIYTVVIGVTVTQATSNLTTHTFTGRCGGNVFVGVEAQDGLGGTCNNSQAGIVITTPPPIAANPSVTNVSCNGGNNGAIDISPTGGVGGYTYMWSNSPTTQDISGLTAATYTVTITDTNNCSTPFPIVVAEPAPITAPAAITPVDCNGNTTGAIDITPAGGTAPYTFAWSDASTDEDISGLAAGSYTVTITDFNSCVDSFTYVITQPQPLVLSETHNDETCGGAADGSIDLTVTGGTGPYTYSWSNGQTTQDISSLPGGLYNVNVTDANGCNATLSVTIVAGGNLTLSLTVINSTCGDNNGQIDLTVSGSVGPYTVQWSSGEGTEDIFNLPPGSYTAVVTETGSGCIDSITTTVSDVGGPDIVGVVTDASSCIAPDGMIDITVTGGSGTYTYSWMPGGSTNEDLTGVPIGTYTVTVNDQVTGCTSLATFNVDDANPVLVGINITDPDCGINNGAIDITPSGGTPGYTFLWSTSAVTEDVSGLGSGVYNVTVTDQNGCTGVEVITLSENSSPTVSAVVSDISCPGLTDGAIDLTISGGSGSYSFAWSNGATTEDISGLSANTYIVVVEDLISGCQSVQSYTVGLPGPFIQTIDITHVTCNGDANGAIDITVTGGNMPYSYLWSPGNEVTEDLSGLSGGNYQVNVTDNNGCTVASPVLTVDEPAALLVTETHVDATCTQSNGSIDITVTGGTVTYSYAWSNGASTEDLTGLAAGLYTVTVTDANGCSETRSVTIIQGNALVLSYTAVNPSCAASDGSIDLTVTGGSGTYTYAWSSGPLTQDISNLAAGAYTVVVTDQVTGCVDSLLVTLTDVGGPSITSVITPASNCIGTDGAIDITVTSGSGFYTFLWNTGATTEDVTGLPIGIHYVQITDTVIGCTGVESFVVQNGNPLGITQVVTNPNCGVANGSIDITVSGGNPGYSYQWSNGATTEDISGLAAGGYVVTVTDAVGCTEIHPYNLSEVGGPLISDITTNVTCPGGADGAIDLTVGGVGPFFYSWSTGSTLQDISNLAAGTYNVFITDNAGCQGQETYTITSPAPFSGSVSITHITCNGANDGAIDISYTGGTMPYSYAWSNSDNTEDISGLAAGTYTVTITDANGCVFVSPGFTVINPAPIVINETHQDITCNGDNDGSIDITVSGGTPGYTYSWSPGGSTNEDLSALSPGTYTVTVTDANGCTETLPITINEPAVLMANLGFTNITCNGTCNGTATAAPTGGTAPYTYLWSNSNTTSGLTGLCAGTYTATVTDANGCVAIDSVVITQPASINASIGSSTNVTCFGLCNGSATVNVIGGTPNYTYLWNTVPPQNTPTASGLCSGNYTVTVTDANGCTAAASVTIVQPNQLVASANVTPASCFGVCDGGAVASATGGTPPYTYLWQPGNLATISISNQCAGNYTLIVTGSQGCADTIPVVITEPAAITATVSTTDALCNGQCNGTATVTPSGGTTPYTYLWDDPSAQATQTAVNLCAGAYNVTVTDANGCTSVFSATVSDQSSMVVTPTTTPASCNGVCDGTASVSVTGGVPPYTYLWSVGGTGTSVSNLCAGVVTVTVTDANGCQEVVPIIITEPSAITLTTNTTNVTCNGQCDGTASVTASGGTPGYTYLWAPGGQTSSSISGLCAGVYPVTVTDANGCTATDTAIVLQPDTITLTAIVTDVSCPGAADGAIDITVMGGTPPYTYLWSPGGQTTEDLTNIPSGSYSVVVTDANGCMSNSFTIGGTFNGGLLALPDGTGSSYSTSINITGLPPGQTVNSANDIANICMNIEHSYIGDLTISLMCPDGNVVNLLETIGIGLPGSNFLGDANDSGPDGVPGTGFDYCFNNNPLYGTMLAEATANNVVPVTDGFALPSGSYTSANPLSGFVGCNMNGPWTLIVTDSFALDDGFVFDWSISFNNNSTADTILTVNEPTPITIDSVVTNATCGQCDGTALVTPSGGTAPYTYVWGNGQTTQTATNLCAGVHQVDVTDANGCSQSFTVAVGNTGGPTSVTVNATDATCGNACDGTASVTPVGGTAPYNYLWIPGGQTTNSVSGLCAGTYYVEVQDSTGCIITQPVIINEPAPIVANGAVVHTTCGNCNGSITLSPTGGTGPYTYLWSNAATTSSITGLCAGANTVTVTDNNGCAEIFTFSITNNDGPVLSVSSMDANCNGSCDGSATVSATGVSPFSYSWSSGDTTATATGLCAGLYTVTVTDNNGCTGITQVTIGEPNPVSLSIVVQDSPTCNGDCDGQLTVIPSGGSLPYTYLWDDPSAQVTATATGLCAGTYSVTVTDANGCTIVGGGTVVDPVPLTSTISATDASCNGVCDGTATVTPTGGAAPYTYAWNDPGNQVTQTATNLCAATYIVTVTDANGCTITDTVVVTQPTPLQVTFSNVQDPLCPNVCNGQATASGTGGTAPYTYAWSNGDTTATGDSLCVGVNIVTVTDANGCTAVDSVTLVGPPALVVTLTGQTNVSCNGVCDGTATISISGGTPGYTILWTNGDTTLTADSLCAGVHSVTVTDSGGCFQTVPVIITEPLTLTAVMTSTDVTCNGNCDGTATATPTGGTTPYTYLWDDPSAQTSQTATGLCPGTYNVTVTDANGCTTTGSVTIIEPGNLDITLDGVTDASCNGVCDGAAGVTVTGGTQPYTIVWLDVNLTPVAFGDTATGLCAGTYVAGVQDANGCQDSVLVVVNEPPAITINLTTMNTSCNGICDGYITLVAGGGVPGYTYQWSNGGGNVDSIGGLCAGAYTVTVTDNTGCLDSATTTILEPDTIGYTLTQTNATCNGDCDGTATVSPFGGVAPYTFLWTNGDTTATADSLCPGVWSVTITDANGCFNTATVLITEPPLLVITDSVVNVTCGGLCDGQIFTTVTGGVPGYTYQWNDPNNSNTPNIFGLCAGTYTLTVTDNNNCVMTHTVTVTEPTPLVVNVTTVNASCGGICDGEATVVITGGTGPFDILWSTNDTTATIDSLCAGPYSVTVTDGNACTQTVNVIILEPPVLTSSITNSTEILCSSTCNATATVTALGGVPNYTYLWNTTPPQITQTATGLCAGVYEVTVTDTINCTTTATVTIVDTNALVASVPLFNNVSCFGDCDGNATAVASGGLPPYSYAWSNNASVPTITGLCAGTYTVTVTDNAGCQEIGTVTITEPTLLTASAVADSASCGGECDGSATVTPNGGTGPYTYEWNDPNIQSGQTANGLCAGLYTVTVTDANGCTAVTNATVFEPPVITASSTVVSPTCTNTADGSIDLTVGGGIPPYTYQWTPGGANTEDLNGILPANYSVVITDDIGCQLTYLVNVSPITDIDANAGDDVAICIGSSLQLEATGGALFTWTPTETLDNPNTPNPIATPEVTTTYILEVVNGVCVDYDTIVVTVNPLPTIDAGEDVTILSDQSTVLTATGAGDGGSYLWEPDTDLDDATLASPTASPNVTTLYYVTGTDTNGCSATDSVEVQVIPGIVFPDGITPNGDGKNETWIIDNIDFFPECLVEVYNRWGQLMFSSKGYSVPWDGRYEGKDLPVGTYYYVIDLNKDGFEPYTGPITIVR